MTGRAGAPFGSGGVDRSLEPRSSGLLFVLSAPSGAGKTTICKAILDFFPDVRQSVSHTTRSPRAGEQDGVDYHFVSPERFQEMIDAGAFVEWAEVYGNRYGTSWASLEGLRAQGFDVILDVDTQGASSIRRRFPSAISVFVLPPSLDALAERLRGRGTEQGHVLEHRLAKARSVIPEAASFDYIIVNDDVSRAVTELRAIIQAERARTRVRLPQVMHRYPVAWHTGSRDRKE
ncbi:MAG TPA: guanylate kinase [Thermodesulfobacteriota bacterium]